MWSERKWSTADGGSESEILATYARTKEAAGTKRHDGAIDCTEHRTGDTKELVHRNRSFQYEQNRMLDDIVQVMVVDLTLCHHRYQPLYKESVKRSVKGNFSKYPACSSETRTIIHKPTCTNMTEPPHKHIQQSDRHVSHAVNRTTLTGPVVL